MEHAASPELLRVEREPVVRALSAAAFLIFFQAYAVAPLVPKLSVELHVSEQMAGLLVPAYVLPYGIATLFYGPLSDRLGRRHVMLALLIASVPVTALTATARGAVSLLLWRVGAGVAMGGIIPLTLAMIGDLYPYRERGRPLGWVFGAIAGGMAFGSTAGALLDPYIGWRGVFLVVSLGAAAVLALAWPHRAAMSAGQPMGGRGDSVWRGYLSLLSTPRGRRAYGWIFVNGAFHSGVFTWLGVYFVRRYQLSETGVGLALLGYGVPGLLLGPTIGRLADRFGRRWLITGGLALAAVVAAVLGLHTPLLFAAAAVTVLSFGYDMSHPLLAGIVTNLDPGRRGQAMGLNAFVLFTGFGLGSVVFGAVLARTSFGVTLALFGGVMAALALVTPALFAPQSAAAQTAEASGSPARSSG